jgi:L-ascorbate metabolism protein UlaG (beta-lactamase superfamily)
MKIRYFLYTSLVLFFCFTNCDNTVGPEQAPKNEIFQIQETLLNNPPNQGDSAIREQTILELDEILKDESLRNSNEVFDFYKSMMEKVNNEINDEVNDGIRIWIMYNHGFIIKTPENVFAIDLVDGYSVWQSSRAYHLPDQLVNKIDVLFISHRHQDHKDNTIINQINNNGGQVIQTNDVNSMIIRGLDIKLHEGLHSDFNLIFEITTENGYKIVHTGDNNTSRTLPDIYAVDLLLLNSWVNENGYTSAVEGMRNCMDKLMPSVMIPGHIQELSHDITNDVHTRVPYEWSFLVDDVTIPSKVQVMAWGEQYNFPN